MPSVILAANTIAADEGDIYPANLFDVRELFEFEDVEMIDFENKGGIRIAIDEEENNYDIISMDDVLHVNYLTGDIGDKNTPDDNLAKSKRNWNKLNPILSKKKSPIKAKLIRDGKSINVNGGLDFSNAVFDEEMGKRCIEKKEEIDTIERSPILECKHR